ncbi:MAG: acetamidase/formamidase family protein [Lentihominibacter sp.]
MKISNDSVVFSFSRNNTPVVRVDAPATVEVETKDCFSNQLCSPEDRMEQLDWDMTNPATGPIYVNGAEAGDTLKVTVNRIKTAEQGVACCLEGEGVLGHRISGSHTKIVKVEDGVAHFAPGIDIPVNTMIGVIGVAPEGEPVNAGTPGPHGGNMDNTMITDSSVLYFPVATEGALLALGDVHAVMGDGEIGVSGLEIPAEVSLTIELIKGRQYEYPVLENSDSFSVIVSRPTVDEAVVRATELMHDFLTERSSLSETDLVMLMSLAGNLQICQVVDPEKTVRFVFPKAYMDRAEF